jgi:stalled ribosome rescue protein Dom34
LRAGESGTVAVVISSASDYAILGSLIQPRDEIAKIIRIKETTKTAPKKAVVYIDAILTVERVIAEADAIRVTGPYRVESTGQHGRAGVWLIDGSEFRLRKQCWRPEDLEALTRRNEAVSTAPISAVGADRVIAEFRELLATDTDLLVFGAPAILYALDHGALKSLVITELALAKLPKDRHGQISDKSGKVRGAVVVVLRKESEPYQEIQSVGGIVGILKYRFDPDECLEHG